ncbi:MAG: hypothetical protein MUC63_09295, partial [Planctomycetes bacterium]|nr:hypothetical protein [Planctomycetota bacterium]
CPPNFRPYRADKRFEKEVARELAGAAPGAAFAGTLPRVSYYAGVRHVHVPVGCGVEQFLGLARAEGASLLVFEEGHFREWAPELWGALGGSGPPPPEIVLERSWSVGKDGRWTVRAYRLRLP